MKLYSLALVSVFSMMSSAHAIEVKSAQLDTAGKNIEVSVVHGGGCGTHEYKLELGNCLESMPVQCSAKIVHITNDPCEALLSRKATFNLKTAGITGDYFANGKLTITGANNSKATIRLPAVLPEAGEVEADVNCVTHTGSLLKIYEADQKITLKTVTGEEVAYGVTDKQVRFLESLPPVLKSTYKLDDGRSVVTAFRGESPTGTGNFIRIGGEYSPDFTCSR